MKNKLSDLRNHLFEIIEKLKDDEIDIEQAKAIASTAQVIVNSAKVEVDYLKLISKEGKIEVSEFLKIEK